MRRQRAERGGYPQFTELTVQRELFDNDPAKQNVEICEVIESWGREQEYKGRSRLGAFAATHQLRTSSRRIRYDLAVKCRRPVRNISNNRRHAYWGE